MWAVFLENPNLEDETGKFRFCTYIQSCPRVTKDWQFEEKVEGAGGTKTLVAALIVKHLKCLADQKQLSVAINSLGYPSTISTIHDNFQEDDEFRDSLIEQGIVPALTSFT
jgi:hypothetical protein